MSLLARLAPFAALALLAPAAAAQSAAPAAITVELNKLDEAGADCRATMVVSNGLEDRLATLKLDLVFFDRDGIVAKRLATELGPLPAGKTAVKTFPVAGMACPAVSKVLVNEVLGCSTDSGAVPDCLERLGFSSRAAAGLAK